MVNKKISLQEMWYEIDKRIQKIEFENLWKGFKKYPFAIYNNESVCFDGEIIPKTDEFIANTAILHDDKWIAIYMVNGEEDLDEISALIVHEMFHAYQMENKDERFPNEMEALVTYDYEIKNISGKYLENLTLSRLLIEKDKKLWFELLARKNYRKKNHSYSYRYESKVEQIEGVANYIELKSLKILNKALYKNRIEKMISSLSNVDILFPIRIGLYTSGALLLIAVDELNIKFDMSFSKTPFSMSVLDEIDEKEIVPSYSKEVESALEQYRKEQDDKISELTQNKPILIGDFHIQAVNIYNAWFFRNFIYTTHFLAYDDNENLRILNGNYLLEMHNDRIKKIYEE